MLQTRSQNWCWHQRVRVGDWPLARSLSSMDCLRKLTKEMPMHIQFLAPNNINIYNIYISLCLENINAHQTTSLIGSNLLLDCLGWRVSTVYRWFVSSKVAWDVNMWFKQLYYFKAITFDRKYRLRHRQYAVFLALSLNYGSSRYGAPTNTRTHKQTHKPAFHLYPLYHMYD